MTCKSCKNWQQFKDEPEVGYCLSAGKCDAEKALPATVKQEKIVSYWCGCCDTTIVTAADFGCVKWAERVE